jgi:adenine deaminase
MARPPASSHVLAVARGEAPADLLIRGGRVFAETTGEWIDTSLAVAEGVIAGWGERDAHAVLDVAGAALTPGFVDAHMHLESTKLWIDAFVATVLPLGTTAVAADPHELANVLGIPGVLALMDAVAGLPITFVVYASSCVPASPFETAGATLDAADIRTLVAEHGAHGIAEVMNFPGVIAGEPEMLARIAAAGGRPVDGHSPGVGGRALDAYLAAGVESDHEATRAEEALEKRRKGMWVFLREGSASRNLAALAETIVAHGTDHAAFCTDDREPSTLLEFGHVNDCMRIAVASGIPEVDALRLACVNPARYHGLHHLGSLGPGHQADILAFDTLGPWVPATVWRAGELVAEGGTLRPGTVPAVPPPALLRDTVHVGRLPRAEQLAPAIADGTLVRAIGVESNSLTTRHAQLRLGAGEDLARAAVIERHRGSGRIGTGFATGFGLARGAIASTVAHDAHNIACVGADTPSGAPAGSDMAAAVARLAELGGGQVAVLDGVVLAELPLPLAGLMSDRPAPEVAAGQHALGRAAAEALGVTIEQPFMQLSFLALSVIPELRLTDGGLVDVDAFASVAAVID